MLGSALGLEVVVQALSTSTTRVAPTHRRARPVLIKIDNPSS
jgi:hypothetical protein